MTLKLDAILSRTRADLPALRQRRAAIEQAAAAHPAANSFRAALAGNRIAVIAEIKRRSPSAGEINPALDPVERAAAYTAAGARAISVLTNGPFFGGSLEDLAAVTDRVSVPVLRKEFILDELQILEARGSGASAVLLIVRALTKDRIKALLRFTRDSGLEAVVEVHTVDELTMALACGADILGVNSRDLDTFSINKPAAWRLLSTIPPDLIAIAESGMADSQDVGEAADAGADAVLVGTVLSAATDPAPLLRRMSEVPRHVR
jgi:indole-3-glycerol phosphate synthase